MDRLTKYIFILFLLFGISCRHSDRDDEAVIYSAEKVDSNRFTLHFYTKFGADSSTIIRDTVFGSLDDKKEIVMKRYDDSAICLVPFTFKDTTIVTKNNLKVVIKTTLQ